MCGLLGFATDGKHTLSPDLVTFIITQMMRLNDTRGGDSFGLAVIRPDRPRVGASDTTEGKAEVPYRIYKQVGDINKHVRDTPWLDGMREVYDAIENNERFVVLGHNRKATTGANTARNAHPFQFGKHDRPDGAFVIGAHNGIVGDWQRYKEAWEITREIQVDSEVIFRGIQKLGAPKAIGQLQSRSAMALTFMQDLDVVHFFRGSNPLTFQLGPHYTFWSSDDYHLKTATFGMRGVEMVAQKDTFYSIDTRTMHFKKLETPPVLDPPFKVETRAVSVFRGRSKGGQKAAWEPFPTAGASSASRVGGGAGSSASSGTFLPPATVILDTPTHLEVCAACNDAYKPWQLLYLSQENGDNYGTCPKCYYYIVQAEAEATMAYEHSMGRDS